MPKPEHVFSAAWICECGHNFSRHGTGSGCSDCECKENREAEVGGGPRLDPDVMPPEELARLRAEGFGHMIGPSRMDDSPGYRRDW